MSAPRVRPPAKAGDDPISGSALGHQPEALVAFLKLYGTLWSHGGTPMPFSSAAAISSSNALALASSAEQAKISGASTSADTTKVKAREIALRDMRERNSAANRR